MAAWSRNHRSCEATWTTLYALIQLRAAFGDAGEIPMSQLTFWTQSARSRDVRARALAAQMDGVFTTIRGARYEDGVQQNGAIAALSEALLTESKTVSDLAEVCDAQYRFWGEVAPEPADASGTGSEG
jgi:hypothetical protein